MSILEDQWPEWGSIASEMHVGLLVDGLPLAQVIESIRRQLDYLRRRPTNATQISQNFLRDDASNNSNPAVATIPVQPVAAVDDVFNRIKELEHKLLEKDQYYVSVIDEINTRLYYIEGKLSSEDERVSKVKEELVHTQDSISTRLENMSDLHTGIRTELETLEFKVDRDKKHQSELLSRLSEKYDLLWTELQALHLMVHQTTERLDRLREENNNADSMEELRIRLNQMQEGHNGTVDRLNKMNREVAQAAHSIGIMQAELVRISEADIARLDEALRRLDKEKVGNVALDTKADKAQLEDKAEHAELQRTNELLELFKASLSASMTNYEAKINKKFSKLADYTARHIRHMPRDAEVVDGDDHAAGAGKLKCLVCDHPIKTVEGESPYQRAKFYNTVGMLRYRKASDEYTKGVNETEGKVTDSMPGSPPESLTQYPVHKYDAVFEYTQYSKRPQSAPMGRNKSKGKISSVL